MTISKVVRKVRMFNKTVRCKVEVGNEVDSEHVYKGIGEVLWIERGEDEYARPHFNKKKTPYVIVYREDWLRGFEIKESKDE